MKITNSDHIALPCRPLVVCLCGEESRRTAILINSQELTDHHEVGTLLTLHPALVERIEIIRDSGAVLYGSRALSGVVNFFTRKGGSEPIQTTLSGGYDSATAGYDAFASVYGNAQGFEYRLAWSESDYDERSTPEGKMPDTSFENESVYIFAGKTMGDHRFDYTYETSNPAVTFLSKKRLKIASLSLTLLCLRLSVIVKKWSFLQLVCGQQLAGKRGSQWATVRSVIDTFF